MITESHIRRAIEIAGAGGTPGRGYDQSRWCGASCCVLGHARILAGMPDSDRGPQPGEIENTPYGRTISRLMPCSSPDVLRVMRAVGADGVIRLSGADLHGADLRVAYLRGADLRGADLRGADLRGADLGDADIRGANLRGADLHGADLRHADLREANLRWADLRHADLHGADLRGAMLAAPRGDVYVIYAERIRSPRR